MSNCIWTFYCECQGVFLLLLWPDSNYHHIWWLMVTTKDAKLLCQTTMT